uniref:Uncharacterized protein n=1 Tax=Graphocephala atropunctata TaxID=36148 RepID=A0A1B6L936_9HEMI
MLQLFLQGYQKREGELCARNYQNWIVSQNNGSRERRIADDSNHLIKDVDSNMAEHLNTSIACFIGGKRVNYAQKRSYKARCAAAVVSHNTGSAYYSLHKTIMKSSPGNYSKLYESRSKIKI